MSSASPFANLLPELLDAVFEQVYADDYYKRTTFACSLVSPHWETVSRRQRFRTVSLSIDDDPADTGDFLRWEAFAASTIFPQVSSCIRKLTLSFTKTADGSMHSGFLNILPLVPQLHVLELRGVLAQRIVADPDSSSIDATRKIPCLSLVGHPPPKRNLKPDPRALCDLLSLFPSLSELELNSIDLRYPTSEHPAYDWKQWVLPAPKALLLRHVAVADVLHGTRLSSRVRSLKLHAFPRHSHSELIRMLAPNLEALDVSVEAAPDLAEFPALRSLTILGYYGPGQWDRLSVALSTLLGNSLLSSFTFVARIWADSQDLSDIQRSVDPARPVIRDIETVLFRLATQGDLRNITFEVQRGFGVEFISAPNLFAAGFPQLVQLGLLTPNSHDRTTSRFIPS